MDKIEQRRAVLRPLIAQARPGLIVEFGCGSGFVLEMLSERYSNSVIVGVDRRFERLKNVTEKGLKNTALLSGDVSGCLFLDETFDTGLFIAVLHEIFSRLGVEGLVRTFEIAHAVLKKNGILLIQDFLKPEPEPVELIFRSEAIERRFYRFAREFRPRKVWYEAIDGGVRTDVADVVEFVSKCHAVEEKHWQEEMNETHFFFTESEYLEILRRVGFTVRDAKKVQRIEDWRAEIGDTIEVRSKHHYPDQWIQLVLKKED